VKKPLRCSLLKEGGTVVMGKNAGWKKNQRSRMFLVLKEVNVLKIWGRGQGSEREKGPLATFPQKGIIK